MTLSVTIIQSSEKPKYLCQQRQNCNTVEFATFIGTLIYLSSKKRTEIHRDMRLYMNKYVPQEHMTHDRVSALVNLQAVLRDKLGGARVEGIVFRFMALMAHHLGRATPAICFGIKWRRALSEGPYSKGSYPKGPYP